MSKNRKDIDLPENAERVFKGVRFDVYHWQQKLFDGSYTTFEKIVRNESTSIIATDAEGFFYINKEIQPGRSTFYTLPSGMVEDNEDPLAGAKRELEEETGLISDNWQLINKFRPSHTIDWAINTYNAKNCKAIGTVAQEPGEKIESVRLNSTEFVDIIMDDLFRDIPTKIIFLEHYYKNTHEQWLKSLI